MRRTIIYNHIKISEALIDEHIDPLMLINPIDASILYANKSTCHALGYDANDIINLNLSDVQELFKERTEWDLFSHSVKEKGTITFQGYHRHKQGYILPVQTKIKWVIHEDKGFFLVNLYYNAEVAGFIEKTNDEIETGFYKSIIENFPGGIAIINIENVFLYINTALEKITGYSRWEIIGKYLLEFIHPNDVELTAAMFAKIIKESNDAVEGTFRFLHKERKWRNIELKIVNMFNNYFVKGIFVSFQDVTEKYEIQEKQRIQKNNLLKIINEVPVQLYAKNWKGEYTLANDSFAASLETSVENLIGKTALHFKHIPEVQQEQDSMDKEVMIKYEPLPSFEQYYKDPYTDKDKWFEISKIPIIFEDNSVHCLTVVIDITDRIAFHEKLVTQNNALQKANKELDRFVYSASHELRAPLTSVLGLVNLAESENNDIYLDEYFRLIKQAINRLDQCIINIINYSRNERVALQSNPIMFKPFIADILEGLQYINELKKIEYVINIMQTEPFYGDTSRLQIILNNLISNAIKYHNYTQDMPWIKIDILVTPNKVFIEISDNGCGIKTEYHHKIFDMFFRVNYSAPGSGLGLYIVKETVQKMNGTVSVESEPNAGTTFHLEIPSLKL